MELPGRFVPRLPIPVLLLAASSAALPAGDPGTAPVQEAARKFVDGRSREILRDLAELAAIPNLAADAENIERNARLLESWLGARGIRTRRLQAEGSPPVVFGDLAVPGARRTVTFYAHYDGQPVDPAEWTTDPWRPVVRDLPLPAGGKEVPWRMLAEPLQPEWRIYGRSVSDDKAPIVALLAALDALREAGILPSVNLKFFLEGEEEAGSPHLAEILRRNADLLRADLWLMCDGPVHPTRRMQVYFGARGVIGLELTVYGALRPLHSGHYGNWAPNPAALLADLIAGMRDPDGGIRIRGFSDQVRPLTREERGALREIPDLREPLLREFGLGRAEGSGRPLEELILRPAMNVRGLAAGAVGEGAANAIPARARASIDFRLVPDQTPEFVRSRVEEHLRSRGFHLVAEDPDPATRAKHPRIVRLDWEPGYPPARTPMHLPAARALVRVVEDAEGEPVIELPTLGGSGPLYLFRTILGAPSVGVPIVNHDNNQHAADENLRLRNLWDGIGIFAAVLARIGHAWDAEEAKGR